jgi:hypothetical protein
MIEHIVERVTQDLSWGGVFFGPRPADDPDRSHAAPDVPAKRRFGRPPLVLGGQRGSGYSS